MLAPPSCCRRYAIQSFWHTRWRLSIRSRKVVLYLALASLPMCRISARSSLQPVCLSKNVSAACSKVCGSPVCCGAGNRSIGTAGGKSSTASLARHHIVKAGPRSGSAGRCPPGSNAPDADQWARSWNEVKEIARTAGRDPNALTGAMYVTVITDEDRNRANERLNAYLEQYYGQPAAVMRSRQACYAGPNGGVAEWLQGYARAGATHLVLRFVGDHERHLETVAALRSKLPR